MKEELKILILEDVAFDAELIEYELRREGIKFLSKRVETKESFISELEVLKPDLILADHSLPKFDGLSALKIANSECPYTPFLFVSGKIGEEFAVNALKEGATDYIFKNNLSKLVPAMQRALKECHEKIEREKAQNALKKAHFELEQQVLERTKALSRVNDELRAEMDERERIENKLKKSLEEKEILLKEIHHRVKNNLQIISSLLNLQSRYINDEEMLDIYKESQNRVKSMAIIHEKLYQSEDLARIDFGDYVKSLVMDLFHSYGVDNIEPDISIRDVLLDINTAIPCGLIVNELVTNSIKHGFLASRTRDNIQSLDERDKIAVNITKENEIYTMSVYDNGIGFPDNLDFRHTDSLGMQLVISLTSQLRGTVELERDNGTLFRIVFKEVEYNNKF
ncbi:MULTISPECIES: histidine kinase dimerization/phosphoacceptor domain -containing protein [Methanobacterium]|jgi:two-component sensor histidine kinase/CheY-like chemotaxis protein|uniref:Response regulator n=1 Tax=Methanobacterium veterum TaxID=408577 RepID=A0A9E4ZXG4_9EURY|nr:MULTISPECIES: histidine kinase dimerization/phosphoacceptor domain -containing protein [Methanobacterium]MCZ3367021.1 response regulator [Methanobacterium veterum]MCZ3373832.1 response regulator [Methanobacterium veterum]